jgi:hypothetical protein
MNDATNPSPTAGCGGDNADSTGFMAHISIDDGNEQGAVLWGSRTNSTACGSIVFANLIITQPGLVKLRITSSLRRSDPDAPGVPVPAKAKDAGKVLIVMNLNVKHNPEMGGDASGRCLFLFREGLCDSSDALLTNRRDPEADAKVWVGGHTRSFLPMSHLTYLTFLSCAPTYEHWHVEHHAYAHGFWADFRTGIDAIWTGNGLPSEDASYVDVLGVSRTIIADAAADAKKALAVAAAEEAAADTAAYAAAKSSNVPTKAESVAAGLGSRKVRQARGVDDDEGGSRKKARAKKKLKKLAATATKQIRRAYYRKSLMWHPDRWVGLGVYSLIVQSAFEAVTRAYERLQATLEWELGLAFDQTESELELERSEEAITPVAPEEVDNAYE